MNRKEFIAMAKDIKKNPDRLAHYRKIFKNVYPFSDGMIKILLANEAKPLRTVMFLNAMLGLEGDKAISKFSLGVQENPGVLNEKTAIFDIYGTTQAGEPVLIEVQQNYNQLFLDRLVYYTSRVISRTVKKSKSYDLPHIYILSILTEDQFVLDRDHYYHTLELVRNRKFYYDKLDINLVELEKFFAIEDRTPLELREQSRRADMLRLFREILEDKEITEEKAEGLLDREFANDVSFSSYTNDVFLLEADGMTDLAYEKEGSYLQGKADGEDIGRKEERQKALSEKLQAAREMLRDNIPLEKVIKYQNLTEEQVKAL